MSLSSLAALSADPREQEVRMLVQLVRLSRVTVLFAEAGSDKSGVVRSSVMPLLQDDRGAASKEVAILLDAWDKAPLATLNARIDEALAQSVGSAARAVSGDAASGTLCARLGARERAFDRTFIIVFDRFEEYLAAPADRPGIRDFEAQFVEAVNSRTLRANFLLSLDEDAAPLLARLRERIPGLGDARVRLPKLAPERAAQGGPQSAASGDDLVGSEAGVRRDASGSDDARHEANAARAGEEAADAHEATGDTFAAVFFGSESQRQQFKLTPSLAERLASMRAEYEAQSAGAAAEREPTTPVPREHASDLHGSPPRRSEIATAGEPVGPIGELISEPHERFASAPIAGEARSDDAVRVVEARTRSPVPRAIGIGVLIAMVLALFVLLGTQRAGEPPAVPPQAAVPPLPDQNVAQAPSEEQTQTVLPADETPVRSEEAYATPRNDMGDALDTETPSSAQPPPPASQAASGSEMSQQQPAAEKPAALPAPAQTRAPERSASATASTPARPLLYIHVRSEAQRARAQRMIEPLARHGIHVSGIKVVSFGPPASDLRYFRSAEREEALRINRALDAVGTPAQRLKYIGGFEDRAPRRQYELWLPPA